MTTLVLHGGAGTIPNDLHDAYRAGLAAALRAGYEALLAGGALEAVLTAVRLMEDDPVAFNAGTGGSPNRDGDVECDAAVMVGSDRSCGAVAGLTRARNPILVAEKVRTATPHVLFVGPGADALVDDPIANAALLTPRSREALERWRATREPPTGSATVGAVALGADGTLAAATSTGGMLGKWPGRVGDSPLIGAGTYADHQVAVSCTGKGEAFIRAVTAKSLAESLRQGRGLAAATTEAIEQVRALGGEGGLIALTSEGRLAVGFSTRHMALAWKTPQAEDVAVGAEAGVRTV